MWSGALKSFQLDANGFLPVVTAGRRRLRRPRRRRRRRRRPRRLRRCPGKFIDESDPGQHRSGAAQARVERRPRARLHRPGRRTWRRARRPIAASPSGRAPAISVWPGRKMVFARGNARRAADAFGLPAQHRHVRRRRDAGTVLRRPHDRHGDDPDLQRHQPGPGGARRPVPARRREPVRQPRRGPERPVHQAADDHAGDRPERGRGAEVLLLLPGRSGRARRSAATRRPTTTERRRRATPHKLGDIFHSEPLLLEHAAVLSVPGLEPDAGRTGHRLHRLREPPRQAAQGGVRGRQRRLPARLRLRRLGPRHGELPDLARPRHGPGDLRLLAAHRHERQVPEPAELPAAAAVLRGRLDGNGGRLHRSGQRRRHAERPPTACGAPSSWAACARAAPATTPSTSPSRTTS